MSVLIVGTLIWWCLTALVVLIRLSLKGVSVSGLDFPIVFVLAPFLFWALVLSTLKNLRRKS